MTQRTSHPLRIGPEPSRARSGGADRSGIIQDEGKGRRTKLPSMVPTKGSAQNRAKWGIHLTQVATRCCGRAKASTKKRIPRLLLWRGVGLRSASDSRSCRPKAATAMNSRVGRLGGHSHDSRNLTFLFRSREATTHRVYLNEVDTPLRANLYAKRLKALIVL